MLRSGNCRRAIALEVEREDLWLGAILLLVSLERLHRRTMSNPALHIRKDDDPLVSAVGRLEDRVEVGSCGLAILREPVGDRERAVALVYSHVPWHHR